MEKKPALLALADGTVFRGRAFGAPGEVYGEVVFNTSMTGYQEILTDPSYCGQIVTMTYPLIGNYGVNPEDVESQGLALRGFVVRELCRHPSNFRATQSLDEYLAANGVIGLEGIDTRALVRRIRVHGAMTGVLSTVDLDDASLVAKAQSSPDLVGRDLVQEVIPEAPSEWSEGLSELAKPFYARETMREAKLRDVPGAQIEKTLADREAKLREPVGASIERIEAEREAKLRNVPGAHVVAIDYGMKWNIPRHLADLGCRVSIVPGTATAKEILAMNPDGVFLSNGPGDPRPLDYAIGTIRDLLGKTPIFGICLGHQLLGLATGGEIYKLKFGHRGANQPVLNKNNGRVEITTQNHGFALDADTLPDDVEVTHLNLNDQTVEGIRHRRHKAFGVQYHPEASAGPHDSHYLFGEFLELMRS